MKKPVTEQPANAEQNNLDEALGLARSAADFLADAADRILEANGLGRPHYRILFHVARNDGLSVGALQAGLAATPQALHRPMRQLIEAGMIVTKRQIQNHRVKSLHLTEEGARVEAAASDVQRRILGDAFEETGSQARDEWSRVMRAVVK